MLFGQLREKEVVDVSSGAKIGYIDDLVFDEREAKVQKIVIYGRQKLLGLMGRENDMEVEWKDIEKIGNDTVLINIRNKENHLQ